jgi:uncharacterized protein Veg
MKKKKKLAYTCYITTYKSRFIIALTESHDRTSLHSSLVGEP